MDLLTRREVAERLGVHINTVRSWERAGLLVPHTRGLRAAGHATMYRRDDVERLARDRAYRPLLPPTAQTG